MKYIILLFLLFSAPICKADINVKLYYEKIENGYAIFADNDEFCTASVKLDFDLQNLRIDTNGSNIYIVEPTKKKQLLTNLLVVENGKAYKFSYNSKTTRGDVSKNELFDRDYEYSLPFKTSNSYLLYQGYDGNFSHQNKFALDFTMPIGTEITAIRDGIVVQVVDENTKSCGTEECKKYNNYILIYQPDGTFAEYVHIQKNGSKVKAGDLVKKGQVIAQSGNVGWSTGPHLHLEVYLQEFGNRETLKTLFKTGTGEITEYLIEKNEYSKNY